MRKTCYIFGMSALRLPFGYDEEDSLCIQLKVKMAQLVSCLAEEEVCRYITDCAFGIPLWSAEIVLAQKILIPKISLYVYMPHENQAVKWAPEWRERYFKVHEKADDVVIFNDYAGCREALMRDADVLVYVGRTVPDAIARHEVQGKETILLPLR